MEGNVKEYRKFWVMYIKKLCDEECRGKIIEICDGLVLEKDSKFDVLVESELGVSREKMLIEIVELVSGYSKLQRIAEMYKM